MHLPKNRTACRRYRWINLSQHLGQNPYRVALSRSPRKHHPRTGRRLSKALTLKNHSKMNSRHHVVCSTSTIILRGMSLIGMTCALFPHTASATHIGMAIITVIFSPTFGQLYSCHIMSQQAATVRRGGSCWRCYLHSHCQYSGIGIDARRLVITSHGQVGAELVHHFTYCLVFFRDFSIVPHVGSQSAR